MTRDDIRAEFARFIEFPPGSDGKYVSTPSALLFAEHVAKMTAEQAAPASPAQPGWCEECSPDNCAGCGGTLIPATGSAWRHKNGNRYTVIGKANMDTSKPDEYPQTVIYRGEDGKVWGRPLSRWHDSMTTAGKQEEAQQ